MKSKPDRGSHLPVLMKLISLTSGPILELGCGMYSTTYLHWACFPTKRRLVTCESKEEWIGFARQFETDFHKVIHVPDWDKLDLNEFWSIAFVDHAPDERRVDEIRRLTHAEYVVAHDADNRRERKYNYRSIRGLFKHRTTYAEAKPNTAIFSNFHNLEGFTVII